MLLRREEKLSTWGGGAGMLSALGLDTPTEAVYRLLAARPEGWGVGQMAERLGLEEQQVRDALDRLAELELLRRSADRPGGWRAIHPELGLQLLLRRQQEELERRRQELDRTHVAVTRMIADFAEPAGGGAEPDSERLIGMDAIRSRLEQIANKATTAVCTFMPGGGTPRHRSRRRGTTTRRSCCAVWRSERSAWTASATAPPPSNTPAG